jgi:predicted DNA binding CopG/RHH family protein
MSKKDTVPSLKEIENNWSNFGSVSQKRIAEIKERNKKIGKKLREKKEAKFTARLNQRDFENFKLVAADKAIPYQTLLGHVIHQYVNGRLIDVTEIEKTFKFKKL